MLTCLILGSDVKALLCLQLLALELLVILDFFHMLFFYVNVELGCLISSC
jgi:hypothetical protein